MDCSCCAGLRREKQWKWFAVKAEWLNSWSLLALAALLSVPPNAWSLPPSLPAGKYVDGDVIITFKQSVDFAAAQQVLTSHSLSFERYFGFLSQLRGAESGLVRSPDRTTAELIGELSADPLVELAEPNYLRWVSTAVPNDSLFTQLWGLQNTGQSVNQMAGTRGDDIRFVDAWSFARTSTVPVVVAVIDTGIDTTHPDLAPNTWTNAAEVPGNNIDDDGNGYADDINGYNFADEDAATFDSGVHGTHVSGTVAAVGNNFLGVIGVDYKAEIMALKASSDGDVLVDSAIIEAVQYATMMKSRGVNVVAINASFGGGESSSVESAAIQAAGSAGIVFCVAAGNNANNHDVTPDYPSSYRLSNMIVVAASNQSDALAGFSDYGPTTVDLAAPGVNILSTVPIVTSGNLKVGTNNYTADGLMFSGTTTGVTATIYDCGLGYPNDFPKEVRNNIALISRGTLKFSEKVENAMAAGARAAVIFNNVSEPVSGTLQYASDWIPAVMISQADGLAIKSLAPVPGTLVNLLDPSQSYALLDGTSMATPHVSGAVAFAAMNFPSETVAQRIQRIVGSVDIVAGLQGRIRTGGRLNLRRIVDTDQNNLPDWWENAFFGRLLGAEVSADADGDRASNQAEWVAGTNPTNAASALRLLLPVATETNVVLRWESVEGKHYRLESSTNLVAGFERIVRSNIPATPPLNSEVDQAPSSTARYYRVLVEE